MMWFVTGMFFLVVEVVVWTLERGINDEEAPLEDNLSLLSEESTLSTLGCFLLIIWMSVVLILNSSYTASLTSILIVEQLSSHVKGIESLIASDVRIDF
ncbi:hypothetical protein VNO80_05901 [Phaseolus coccineus]|uniref:Ionotropic glutamate receptor C-terminal domain-containing protein n=1 Tax=Phaseolus coccineus TaxID=3886 RepID=A0AAN9NH43_PHACN